MNKRVTPISHKVFDSLNVLVLTLFLLITAYPFYYVLIYSLSNPQAALRQGIYFLPRGLTLNNYIRLLQTRQLGGFILVSVLRTVSGAALAVFCSSLFSYTLTRPEMYLRRFFYRLTVVTMFIGAGLIPTYLTYVAYGLRNSFLVYILPGAVGAFNVVLIKTYMEQLPASLEESAMLDGAGYFTIYSRIIFPLSMPIIATVAVFAAVGQWNAWFDTYIYISDKRLFTMSYVLLNYLREAQALAALIRDGGDASAAAEVKFTPDSVRMTITMITVLPIIFVYPYMQKYFMKGIMLGAIKG